MMSGRARIRMENQIRLDYLKGHIEAWARDHPELVRAALLRGTERMWRAVRLKHRMEINQRTGSLFNSIKWRVGPVLGTSIDGEVYTDDSSGNLQKVKQRALELGSYREHPGGVPYIKIGGRTIFIRKETAEEWERQGRHVARTKGPYGIRLRKRPVFKPMAHDYREPIMRDILSEILEGFKRERASVGT
jgi:hypothetical protein